MVETLIRFLLSNFTLTFLVIGLIASDGDWLPQTGRPAEATEALALAHAHPASDHESRARVQPLLATAATHLPAEVYAAAAERGRNTDLAEMASRLAPILAAPHAASHAASSIDFRAAAGRDTRPPSGFFAHGLRMPACWA